MFFTILMVRSRALAAEIPFLDVDVRVCIQRRRQRASPGDVFLRGLLVNTLVGVTLGGVVGVDPRLALVMGLIDLYYRVFPRMRREALSSFDSLEDLREVLAQINRIEVWAVGAVMVFLVLLRGSAWEIGHMGVIALPVRPRTLQPFVLTSTVRDGVVDDGRVRTAHTDTHWVVEIVGPLTLRIPRTDPDLADLVMVLLYEGTGSDGRGYLDQATIGRIFRLSRQMTNVRIALYKVRERIEDVLSRQRHNYVLRPPLVDAIHRILLEDPLCGATEIRHRLVDRGILSRPDAISLPTVTRAIQTADYAAIRQRILDLVKTGDLVPNHEKLTGILLGEMAVLAEAAGKEIGQQIVPVARLIEAPPRTRITSGVGGCGSVRHQEDVRAGPAGGTDPWSSGWRMSFMLYFTCGASYREIASHLGVSASTIYRRLIRIRRSLPSLQRSLGAIRFSGVVAIDEKYILAPKPHREGKMARWVYLFVAIDPYTYDLLHAEVYPARTTDCARAFLVGLKAQGVLTPKVIVTDLWGPYETALPEAYPGAAHHQCVFHAEQAASTLMRDNLGREYRSIPEAKVLWDAIVDLFRAGCRRTLIRRYQKLLARKEGLLAGCPRLEPVFASLARHFERLANAYSDRRVPIPLTNNAVERVIRCFTRRYKTMAGFQTLETAREYVGLWAYYYRFRPFSPDARPGIRNRCPLEIAGYEVQGVTCLDLVMPPPRLN